MTAPRPSSIWNPGAPAEPASGTCRGAALVVGGIVRYATRDAGAPVDVAAAPLGGGWTLTAVGRL